MRERLGGGTVVVKAQIHAGGRGKGGGVKLAHNPAEAESLAEQILGMTLVTHQTGPEGRLVKRVLIEEGLDIARELYLGIVIDRASGRPVFMASSEGGVEIEVVAAEHPEKILKEFIDPSVGFQGFQARKLAFGLGLEGKVVNEAVRLLQSLYRAFEATDASLVEINPFVTTRDGRALALDAKMNFDDNALYRHPEIRDLRDLDEEDPLEVKASNYGLNYIRLDGNVGCMVNGAGLAMATMDIIQYAGSRPANFLDVGGGANEEQVRRGFEIILSDHQRARRADQHFRRHHALRHRRQRRGVRGENARHQGADCRPAERNQRRTGPENSEGIRLEFRSCQRYERGGGKGRCRRKPILEIINTIRNISMSILVDEKLA